MYDTIIIGAGMSGLAAGIRLAHYDQRVCILEKHTTIGGLNSFYRMNGRDFDVGLHAVTNFSPRGARRGPLAKLLRQLRLRWEDLALAPQTGSAVRFPGVELEFGNDPELLAAEIATQFPSQIDGYRRLVARLLDYDDIEASDQFGRSVREVIAEELSDPLLIEMLLCPLMWYGNARERDMDFGQFSIMFRACFLEGFARPFKGVRLILKQLIRQYRGLGGELKLRSGVQRICVDGDRAIGVRLEDGRELQAQRILSSAGMVETMRLCDEITEPLKVATGRLSFIESISVLDRQPRELGIDKTIVFYNDSERFHWERPEDRLCDPRTGVICSPNNYFYADGQQLPEGVVRITTLANHHQWCALSEKQYLAEKVAQSQAAIDTATHFVPDFRRHVVESDVFTPKTIQRFTWHDNGAVYGAPDKRLDGTTHLKNLYICGTDQGYVGIIGAILSGIGIANRYCLRT